MPRVRAKQKTIHELLPTDLPDKPDVMNAKHPLTRQKLRLLRDAELPRDFPHFNPWFQIFRETPEGKAVYPQWFDQIKSIPGFHNNHDPARLLFFQLLQFHLVRTSLRKLEELLHPRKSPKWKLERSEINPARRAKLFREAFDEDETARAAAAATVNPPPDFELIAKMASIKSKRDQDYTPDRPELRSWFTPMTTAEYVEATATTRRTINKFLKDYQPLNPNKGRFEPYVYSAETNFAVLNQWLSSWLKKDNELITYTACTVAFCEARDRDQVVEVKRRLGPVFEIIEKKNLLENYNKLLPELVLHFTREAPLETKDSEALKILLSMIEHNDGGFKSAP